MLCVATQFLECFVLHAQLLHFLMVLIIILTIWITFSFSGNVFVIAAIILERNLQSVANYLILSLAVADLLVAVLVMPLGAIYEVRIMAINNIKWAKSKNQIVT